MLKRIFGRSERRQYWLAVIALTVADVSLLGVTHNGFVVSGISLCVWLVIAARRLHDFGASGWWAWLQPGIDLVCGVVFVTAVQGLHLPFGPSSDIQVLVVAPTTIATIIFLGVRRGDPGDNRYGRGRKSLDVAVFD